MASLQRTREEVPHVFNDRFLPEKKCRGGASWGRKGEGSILVQGEDGGGQVVELMEIAEKLG